MADARPRIAVQVVAVEIQSFGPRATFLARAARRGGIAVGSSHGAIRFFSLHGYLRDSRVMTRDWVCGATDGHGRLGAVWCRGELLFLKQNKTVAAGLPFDWPSGMAMFGDDVVLWRDTQVYVLDARGTCVWSAEFSKKVSGVSICGDALLCAAGQPFAFRRRRAS